MGSWSVTVNHFPKWYLQLLPKLLEKLCRVKRNPRMFYLPLSEILSNYARLGIPNAVSFQICINSSTRNYMYVFFLSYEKYFSFLVSMFIFPYYGGEKIYIF